MRGRWLRLIAALGIAALLAIFVAISTRRKRLALFDEIERRGDGPKLYAEGEFAYLNTSARPGVAAIRRTLEMWFARYPASHRSDLRAQFRADGHQFRSAFFELFLHELLLRLDCKIEVHPKVAGTDRRPDFLVTSRIGAHFYLEATLATDISAKEAAAQARKNQIYDAITKLQSPDFSIGISLGGMPQRPPSGKKIRLFLAERLKQLNHVEVAERFRNGGFAALPRWLYRDDGWVVEFFPIPKSPELRGKPGVRPIGIEFEGMQSVETREAIRDAVLRKSGRYGGFDLPYVVAVNVLADFVDETDAEEALFGFEQVVFREGGPLTSAPNFGRALNGVWNGPKGPQNTRVSAVLILNELTPSGIAHTTHCLYFNPWASRPYSGELSELRSMVPSAGGKVEYRSGKTLSTIFDLPAAWPGR